MSSTVLADSARKYSRDLIGVALITLAIAFAFQGSRGLWEPDEGYFGATAVEMYDGGDWLIPHLHGDAYPEKPPLMYWGMVAGMKILGRNEWGMRAFYAICFALTSLFVMLTAKSMWGRREAVLAGIMHGTMILPVIGGFCARPDSPLALCTTASLYCFWRSLDENPGKAVLWKMLMCVAFGFGFLAKGPATLVPALPMFIYLLIYGKTLRYFLTPWAVVGAAIFLAIGFTWYWVIAQRLPGAAAYCWDNQVLGRLVSTKYRRNPGLWAGVKLYMPDLLGGALPWVLIWPVLAWRSKKSPHGGKFWPALKKRPALVLVMLWAFVQFAVLMAATSKLPLYLLPMFPALALLTARFWVLYRPLFHSREVTRGLWTGIAMWAILLVTAKGVAAYKIHPYNDGRQLWRELEPKLPADCNTILILNDNMNGLTLYTSKTIENVAIGDHYYPIFVPPKQVNDAVAAAVGPGRSCAIISKVGNRAANPDGSKGAGSKLTLENMRALLAAAHVDFQELAMPFKRTVFLCKAKADAPAGSDTPK